jgi:hypothetical protein
MAASRPLPMAADPNARRISIGFSGGSLSGSRGLLTAIFGPALVNAAMNGSQDVSVKGHTRTRVIGGPSKSIAANSYLRSKFPSSRSNGGAGGEAIRILVDGDWWTARLSGAHQDFNYWLENSTWASNKTVLWKSEKGTAYGPFTPSQPTT